MQRFGAEGLIEEGKLKGRKFIIPSIVHVEKGLHSSGQIEYAKACLIHQKFVPDQGCPECITEIEEKNKLAQEVGL